MLNNLGQGFPNLSLPDHNRLIQEIFANANSDKKKFKVQLFSKTKDCRERLYDKSIAVHSGGD
jgi:hypothetical protein